MYSIVNGYGVDMSAARYKDDVYEILLQMLKDADSELYEQAKEYLRDAEEGESELEAFESFVIDYENDTYLWGDIEGLLVDFINEQECVNTYNNFHYDDYCIYVPCYILPEQATPLTQEKIANILAKYLMPLLEEPLDVTWYDINLNA